MRVTPRRWLIGCWVLALAPACGASAQRNVILFIGDGMGFNHVAATRLYLGRPGVHEGFPVRLAMSTYSASGAAGYDPVKAWQSLEYLKDGATDSAAAATAMACGVKTKNGAIGVDADGRPVANVVEVASAAGKTTGVVSSVQWSHATPAGMVAHAGSRGSYAEIAAGMLASETDLILGAGHPLYDGDSRPAEKPEFQYVGGESIWGDLVRGAHRGWAFFDLPAEFAALAAGRPRLAPGQTRVCGTARVGATLQAGRAGADKADLPGADPRLTTVPTLAEMTLGALAFLSRDPDGLFLMVEGGAIDWAAHENLLGRAIEETAEFNAAVAATVEWITARDAWDETLVIVTADHETGALWGEPAGTLSELTDRGAGQLPGAAFNSGGHTNALVPLYARGAGAERLTAVADQLDPRRGAYLDNAELGAALHALLRRATREAAPTARRNRVGGRR